MVYYHLLDTYGGITMDTKILAKVGNTVITESDINNTIKALGPRGAGYNTPEGRKALLEQIIAKNLFLNEARANFYEADSRFQADLATVKDEMLANFAIEKAISTVTVTDADVKAYYDEHKDEFKSPETVTASHILIEDEAKIKEVYEDIKGGKITFEDAAKEFSTCPSGKQGGSLGEFTRGQMVPEFENAAFNMEVGEISQPVKTQFGFHLIKLEAKEAAGELPYEKVAQELKKSVLQNKQQAAYASKLNQLKILYPVDIY